MADLDKIVLDPPEMPVAAYAATGIGSFRSRRGKVTFTSACDECDQDTQRLIDAETMLKIAAAVALVARHAEANPDPAHDLAVHLHTSLGHGSRAGAEACDCMTYAEETLKYLAEVAEGGVS